MNITILHQLNHLPRAKMLTNKPPYFATRVIYLSNKKDIEFSIEISLHGAAGISTIFCDRN
jgi:hypothetical protein